MQISFKSLKKIPKKVFFLSCCFAICYDLDDGLKIDFSAALANFGAFTLPFIQKYLDFALSFNQSEKKIHFLNVI